MRKSKLIQQYELLQEKLWRVGHVVELLDEYDQIQSCKSARLSAERIADSLYFAYKPMTDDKEVFLRANHSDELTTDPNAFLAAEKKANALEESEGKRVLLKILGVLGRTPKVSDPVIKAVLKTENDFFEELSNNEFPLDQREKPFQVHSKLRKVRGRVLPFCSKKDHHHSGLDIRERGHD